jgi:hypothetical protein
MTGTEKGACGGQSNQTMVELGLRGSGGTATPTKSTHENGEMRLHVYSTAT